MKCSVFLATSVDNFIAKSDDDITWLFEPEYALEDTTEDFGFKAFLASVDVIVMGRRTFEKVLTLGEWPYGSIAMRVLTHNQIAIPESVQEHVSVLSGTPPQIIAELSQQGYQHVYVDGGDTIRHFLTHKLINELTLTQIPVLLGQGIPLFDNQGLEQRLLLRSSTSYPNGFVKSIYDVR